jgi:hypothetical protein
MRRVLLLLPLCFISGCYSYPYYDDYSYYRAPRPPGYPAYYAPGYAPNYGSQNYAPPDQLNDPQSDRPRYASPAPDYGQPPAPLVEDQPPHMSSPQDQNQSQYPGSAQPGFSTPSADCDTAENPMACN